MREAIRHWLDSDAPRPIIMVLWPILVVTLLLGVPMGWFDHAFVNYGWEALMITAAILTAFWLNARYFRRSK